MRGYMVTGRCVCVKIGETQKVRLCSRWFVRNFTNVCGLPYVIIPAESLLKLDDALCLMTISANMA